MAHHGERLLAASVLTAALGVGGWAAGAGAQPPPADLILHHGVVVTMDTRRPRAQAVAIRGGAIVALVGGRTRFCAKGGSGLCAR